MQVEPYPYQNWKISDLKLDTQNPGLGSKAQKLEMVQYPASFVHKQQLGLLEKVLSTMHPLFTNSSLGCLKRCSIPCILFLNLFPFSSPRFLRKKCKIYDQIVWQISSNSCSCFQHMKHQGAFHALRPEDLRRRPDFFVGVAASFLQQNWFLACRRLRICLPWRECEVFFNLLAVSFDNT